MRFRIYVVVRISGETSTKIRILRNKFNHLIYMFVEYHSPYKPYKNVPKLIQPYVQAQVTTQPLCVWDYDVALGTAPATARTSVAAATAASSGASANHRDDDDE